MCGNRSLVGIACKGLRFKSLLLCLGLKAPMMILVQFAVISKGSMKWRIVSCFLCEQISSPLLSANREEKKRRHSVLA